MMQLFAINDSACTNEKMSTLGETLETTNLTLDTINCSNNVSQNENSKPYPNINVKNETINGMNQGSLNINGIIKINEAEIDDETENGQAVVENKIETNGHTNGNSVRNVDCKISADDMNNSETNLEDKEEFILTNDIEVKATKNIVDEVSSEISSVNETNESDKNTSEDIDTQIGDNETASQDSDFSTNSEADKKEINISSQLKKLENDASIEDDAGLKSPSTKEINKEIGQEMTSKDICLNLIEENKADSLHEKESNYEVVTDETEKIVLPCRDSTKLNAENKEIFEESTKVPFVDKVSEISEKNSHKVDHVFIDKLNVDRASDLPIEELSEESTQKVIMDIDDEQIDSASQDCLKKTSENESMVDNIILDEAPSDYISARVEKEVIGKQNLEEASNLPLEGSFEETNQIETIDINKSVISDNISNKGDHVSVDKISIEEASNLPIEELLKETNQNETMAIDDGQKDTVSSDHKPHTQNNAVSEKTNEKESIVDIILDEAPIISDDIIISAQVDKELIREENLDEASDLPIDSFEATNQKETIDIDAVKESNNEVKLENGEMLKIQITDVDDTVACTSEKKAVEIISDRLDSIKNSNEGINSAEENVAKEPASPSKENKTETTDVDSKISSKEVKLNQNDNVVMDIDDAEKMSPEKSALPTDVDSDEINIETKKDEALAVKLDTVEVEQKQKVNVDMDIDDVEEFSTVVSTLSSDDDTKEINTETNSNEKDPTGQDPVVCLTDKNETNLKERNLMKSRVEDNESSGVISMDERENDANQEKPVISHCSVAPVERKVKQSLVIPEKRLPVVCKLSNTMDILSDDEDEPSAKSIESEKENVDIETKKPDKENKWINLDDDDDIMFIEDTNSQEPKPDHSEAQLKPELDNTNDKTNFNIENENSNAKLEEELPNIVEEGKPSTDEAVSLPKEDETIPIKISEEPKPIITKKFLQSVTKNLAEMTRNELEDFCILKLVESVVDKSNLNEIKSKMKAMTQTLEDLRKKAAAVTKQNRDLQVVVKTVQEDQKKRNTNSMPPMKITRSVGMQVVLTGEKCLQKRKPIIPVQTPPPISSAKTARTSQGPKNQPKPQANIPVPRLVPASSPTLKPPTATVTNAKVIVKNATPQRPEKRPHNKIASPVASSVTVDLTDDEPPSKITTKNPTPPVRLVPSQNLMPKNRPQFTPNTNNNTARESPRKVYIPISSNNPRPVGKNFSPTSRFRPPVIHPSVVRMQTVRVNQVTTSNRHPAPLPDAMKQYQPPGWKALPPAPDLKLSKVDSGIIISWKFEGYQPDSYEEVASFQLYAYQETPAPPSTALWKKIGDIKALPLPMACTLTQFMSGFKYYFAVRAIDVKSRTGPFSLPGSIMLISKN